MQNPTFDVGIFIDKMHEQMNISWTPSESFWIYNGSNHNFYYEKGKTYRGIPYVTQNVQQSETFAEFIVDGVLDLSLIEGVVPCNNSDTTKAMQNFNNFPGANCSTAVITSWNTVLNKRYNPDSYAITMQMMPGKNKGIVPVGKYVYTGFANTVEMVQSQTLAIRSAYKLLQPGDAVVTWTEDGGGHVRMVVANDTVNKKITTIECANWKISSNSTYQSAWEKLVYTYDNLIETSYIPIGAEELITGCSDNEYTVVTNLDLENDLPQGELKGEVISNRQVISVEISATDMAGGTTKTVSYRPYRIDKLAVNTGRVSLNDIDLTELGLISGKEYKLNLSVRVAGLTPSAPTIKLITDYVFVYQ